MRSEPYDYKAVDLAKDRLDMQIKKHSVRRREHGRSDRAKNKIKMGTEEVTINAVGNIKAKKSEMCDCKTRVVLAKL